MFVTVFDKKLNIGWGAAKALCESDTNCRVTLIDALPDPTGVSSIKLKEVVS